MSLQRYKAQHLSQDTERAHGGRRMMFGPESVYLEADVDAALASKDRDLADANHALLLANSNAAAFQRVAEELRSALQIIRDNVSHAGSVECGLAGVHIVRLSCEQYDAIAKVLKPTTGASNG